MTAPHTEPTTTTDDLRQLIAAGINAFQLEPVDGGAPHQ